ncbi:unnamed protein product, partial [Phaeothamnion confervicola]
LTALQGAFEEHARLLRLLGVEVREVRLPEQFEGLDGIVLPGGESTAMALIGERWGVFPKLKEHVAAGRPAWGTCAGMILLSDSALMQKQGGQSLVGGLDVEVCRNYFGSQISSFEQGIDTSALGDSDEAPGGKGGSSAGGEGASGSALMYPAVFIRAPAILRAAPDVKVLSKVRAFPCNQARRALQALYEKSQSDASSVASGAGSAAVESSRGEPETAASPSPSTEAPSDQHLASFLREGGAEPPEVIVAVQRGNILATAFHPELTDDLRWHKYFVDMVMQ